MGQMKKRGKYYHAIIWVNGKKVWRSLKTGNRKEAEKRMRELETRAAQGDIGDNETMTFGDFLDQWLELYAKINLRITTYESYEIAIRCHIKPSLGKIRLGDLKPIHFQQYFAEKRKEGLSNTTIKYHHKVLRSALNTAVDWEYITKNVATKATPPPPSEFEPQTWTLEEARRFLEAVREDRLFALYATALLTGMRRGEILGLKWSDVNFQEGYLRVVRQLVNTRQGVVVQEPKSKKGRRSVLVGPALVEILRNHKAMIEREKAKAKDWVDEDWVFPNRKGRYIDPNNLARRHFPRMIKKANVSRIRFHDLRHTHFTDLLEAGVHLKVAGERAGHSSITVTGDVYSHVRNPIQREAALLSEQRLLGSKTVAKSERHDPEQTQDHAS